MKNISIIYLLLLSFLSFDYVNAQEEPDDIALVEDKFQIYYFEALKQKGIENYDRAIIALEKCVKTNPDDAFVYNEFGKNYLALKKYKEAYNSFEKAHQLDPANRWYLHGMYEVCYETKDENQSIILVQKLIAFDPSYKEDLTSLYMNTGQYDKALELINDLNLTVGKSEKRENYKKQILSNAKYQKSEKEHLLEMIVKFPKDENNYLALIYIYSENNEEEKALEIAQKLEKEIPSSDWAQVSLFKFHLNNNDGSKAAQSMKKVIESSIIDKKIKHRVINEFLIFVKQNSSFDTDLQHALRLFSEEKDVNIYKEVGVFYFNQTNYQKALEYFELSDKHATIDLKTIQLMLKCFDVLKDYDGLLKKSNYYSDLYPMEPIFYFYNGQVCNILKDFKKAKNQLETGLDYIIDHSELERNFYLQLSKTYEGLGDLKKKDEYLTKANKLLKK